MTQKKTINGNPNILSQEQEQMRLQVVDLEMKARYWEAQWKIRFYTLEADKMQTEYDEWMKKEKAKQEEALRRFQEQIDKMNQEAQKKGVIEENKEFLDSIPDNKSPLTVV